MAGSTDYPVATDRSFPPNLTPCDDDFVVAVIDTGVVLDDDLQENTPHPWLADHVFYEPEARDVLGIGRQPTTEGMLNTFDAHGTFVAGLVLREAPAARVHMYGVLDRAARNNDEAVAAAIRAAVSGRNPAKVVNLSFNGSLEEGRPPAEIQHVLDQEIDWGQVVVVAAAGNQGTTGTFFPAASEHVVSVGAVDETRIMPPGAAPPIADFSNSGDWIRCYASGVQVLGPLCWFKETGEDLADNRPSQHFRGWALWSGTSFAAATVTGRIARVAMDHRCSAPEAQKIVLNGPKIARPDTLQSDWPTYVRGVASTWPATQ